MLTNDKEGKMMPLIFAEKEQPQIIKKTGGSPEVKKHLEDLGFNVGGEVSLVSTLGTNLVHHFPINYTHSACQNCFLLRCFSVPEPLGGSIRHS